MLTEANKHLKGQALVLALTSACMTQWYQIVGKFSGKPEVYDMAPGKQHDSYNIIKMSPGADVREDTYQFLQDVTSKLSKSLNSLFGKDIFEPKIQRGQNSLQALVAFSEAKGGVFQVKGEMAEGSTSIFLTMPNEAQLQLAFSKMTGTPHPDDGLVDDDMGELEDVAGDAVPEYDTAGDVDQGGEEFDLPAGSEEPPVAGIEDEEDLNAPRRFGESFSTFFGKNTNDDKDPEDELEEANGEAHKVVYDDNGVRKEKIVDNEQKAEQEARRNKGKVVSQDVKESEIPRLDSLKADREDPRALYSDFLANGPDDFNEDELRAILAYHEKTGSGGGVEDGFDWRDIRTKLKDAIGDFNQFNANYRENVSVGAAMGTSAQPTVYVPNARKGFTGGPFGSAVKRR